MCGGRDGRVSGVSVETSGGGVGKCVSCWGVGRGEGCGKMWEKMWESVLECGESEKRCGGR